MSSVMPDHPKTAAVNLAQFASECLSSMNKSSCLATVIGFSGDPVLSERLKEMGVHPGTQLQVVGRAPFQGPFLLRFGNTVLALRHQEAVCALVQI